MSYGIYFDSRVPAGGLRQALHTIYDVALELIYVGPHEELNAYPAPTRRCSSRRSTDRSATSSPAEPSSGS